MKHQFHSENLYKKLKQIDCIQIPDGLNRLEEQKTCHVQLAMIPEQERGDLTSKITSGTDVNTSEVDRLIITRTDMQSHQRS